jgi:hypothetical protein
MRFLSPGLTESIIQILCIAGPVAAGYFAISTINPKNVWLSIFLLPLALNQMLFLGLYNHSLSIAAFFIVVGTYFWMSKAPSYSRAIVLSGAILLVFFCHASGFVMAFTGLGTISLTLVILSFSREHRIMPALKSQRYTILSLLVPLPLGAIFLASGGKSITKYGVRFVDRISLFAKLHLLAVNYPMRDRFVAVTLSGLLVVGFGFVAVRIISQRRDLPQARRDQAIGIIVAAFAATAIMLAFPDIMGGGWTHFRRFEVFPYFWIILVLALEDFSTWMVTVFTVVGASAAIVLIASTFSRQRTIREQMVPLYAADSLIGSHCSVLPIVVEPNLVDKNSFYDWMDYEPFYQSASRLELHDDRVVLFNYLARLAPYPVHFRPNVEPQENIFLWKPQQTENDVEKVDIPGFEAKSSMRVDYILLWGNPERRAPDVRLQVQNAISQFDLIYKSANGNVKLYRRHGNHNASCLVNP